MLFRSRELCGSLKSPGGNFGDFDDKNLKKYPCADMQWRDTSRTMLVLTVEGRSSENF